jgi:hypothetical protein
MFPDSTSHDHAYQADANFVLVRQFSLRRFTLRINPTDLNHIFLSQLCSAVSRTSAWSQLSTTSLFANSIRHIRRMRTEKQVIWAHTRAIVAAMQHKKTIWNLTNVKFVRKAMCSYLPVLYSHSPVTAVMFVSDPIPAGRGLLDVLPKSFNGRERQHTRGQNYTRTQQSGEMN